MATIPDVEGGEASALPELPIDSGQGAAWAHRARLSPVPLSGLHEAAQRTEQWSAEPDAISKRRDRARGALAAALQTQSTRLAEKFLIRGFVFSYEAVRDW